jgi:ribonucleases P/MRP protein subunit RPP40
MYADDTKIFHKADCKLDTDQLQKDLDELGEWSREWQMRFNVEKCKVMHLGGGRNGKMVYSMVSSDSKARSDLATTELEKDLGIWCSSSLKEGEHVARAAGTANRILGLIKRTFTYLDEEIMRQLYTALVRPHLEYGNVVWHPYLKKDIEMLERVQHRATKMVPGLSKISYEERLKKMNLPTLVYRRERGDAIEVYKYMHGKYSVDDTTILPRQQNKGMTTRGHDLKLLKRNCHGQIRANFFGYRVVNHWNSLPREVVHASSVNCFKGRYDRWRQTTDGTAKDSA